MSGVVFSCQYIDRDNESLGNTNTDEDTPPEIADNVSQGEKTLLLRRESTSSSLSSASDKGKNKSSCSIPRVRRDQCSLPDCWVPQCSFSWLFPQRNASAWGCWSDEEEEEWVISAPTNVVHLTHIGFTKEDGFQMPILLNKPMNKPLPKPLVPPKPPVAPPAPPPPLHPLHRSKREIPTSESESDGHQEEGNEPTLETHKDPMRMVYTMNAQKMKSLRSLITGVNLQPASERKFVAEVKEDGQQDLYSLISTNLSGMRSQVTGDGCDDEDGSEDDDDSEWD